MSDPLATYLHDHLAGAEHAIALLKHMRDKHTGDSLGPFASGILADIEEDRATLRRLAESIGATSHDLKEVTAWLAEKVSRLKLSHTDTDGGLGTFEALEFLAVGIHGKLALWRALAAASASDARLKDLDYEKLSARAQAQHDKVEQRRLEAARTALRRTPK
ncbi:MAG: hypothetical protein M3N22_08190 [Acidobacteriota bacterium]|nr:hypothetical protein [Acidobacteriota bacterium]